jgi:hypothetical protein
MRNSAQTFVEQSCDLCQLAIFVLGLFFASQRILQASRTVRMNSQTYVRIDHTWHANLDAAMMRDPAEHSALQAQRKVHVRKPRDSSQSPSSLQDDAIAPPVCR